jgi:hypothetical protein
MDEVRGVSTDKTILAPDGAGDQETFLESLGQEPRSQFEQEYIDEQKAAEKAWLNGDPEGWAKAAIEYRKGTEQIAGGAWHDAPTSNI